MSSRIDKLNKYLVGDGLFSRIPKNEAWFYGLAGLYSHDNWPTKPCDWKKQQPEVSANKTELSLANVKADDSDQIARERDVGDSISISACQTFRPKLSLPAPIFQQTFRTWKSTMDMNLQFRRIRRNPTINLQPLDDFPSFFSEFVFDGGNRTGFFNLIQEFLKIFFDGMDIKLLSPVNTGQWKVTSRLHKLTGEKQLLVTDLQRGLAADMASSGRGGQVGVGVTWTDLYPEEKLNFVLGQACVKNRCAVWCFGRFETKLYESGVAPPPPPITAIDGFLLHKMIKVVAHETCHIFYMAHCVFYECLMNESNSVSEAIAQPLFLCPVCLRKLQKVCGFDISKRYERLLRFLISLNSDYPSERLTASVEWLKNFIQATQRTSKTDHNSYSKQ